MPDPSIVDSSVKVVSIDSLIPHPQNVRKGNVQAIRESLMVHGQYRPVLVQKSTNHIVAGNHTYAAARQLGWSKIQAAFIDVDDAAAIRIMLVDNRTTELASNNEAALLELLRSLDDDIAGSGYDAEDLDDLIFKVEGHLGTMTDALSASERLEGYEARGIKSIVLPFDNAEYETLMPMITEVRNALGLETNSQLFAYLVRAAHA